MLMSRSGFTFSISATTSATLSASTWLISIGVLQRLATFSQLTRRREARWIFLNTSRFIAHFWAVTDPAAPAPIMRTLSKLISRGLEVRHCLALDDYAFVTGRVVSRGTLAMHAVLAH